MNRHLLAPIATIERARIATSAYELWKQYRNMYVAAEKECKNNPKLEAKLAPHVATMIFEAEGQYRVFLKELLITLNAMRDTGLMEEILKGAIKTFSEKSTSQFLQDLTANDKELLAHGLNQEILKEAISMFKKYIQAIKSKDGQLHVSAVLNDQKRQLVIEPTPRPGQLGRIECNQFFGSSNIGQSIGAAGSIFVSDTCHVHRGEWNFKQTEMDIVDVYGLIVGAMGFSKESLYWLGRRTSEIGLGAFTGRDPFTAAYAAAIIIVLIGGCLVAAGALTGDQGLVAAGLLIIVAGGALAVGAYVGNALTVLPVPCLDGLCIPGPIPTGPPPLGPI